MNNPKELYVLLDQYLNKKIDSNTFCDEFTYIYALKTDYEKLSAKEHELFKSLCDFTKRFSPYEEDLKLPNVYYNEKDIQEKAEEIAKLLNK